tara:strand:+ start:705 stop:1604 length:900 start_codon:yes stop_codon:yes gene_type:complete
MKNKEVYKSGFAALIGRPNVGKSTLLNQLVSEKIAATSKSPQTTRNKITGVCHFPAGQIILMDTPGIHKAKSKLNRTMVQTSLSVFGDVDVILFLIDALKGLEEEDEYALKALGDTVGSRILVLNKIDLIPKGELLPLIAQLRGLEGFLEIVPISAKKKDGLEVLTNIMLNHLPEGPAYFPEDMITDCPEKFLIGEIVREKTIRLTRLEIPYSVAAVVDQIGPGKMPGVTVIYATLFTEKTSQKKILIGQNGTMLKKIGSLARNEIEKRFGGKAYLNLHVKVKENWRESDYCLKEFGYR